MLPSIQGYDVLDRLGEGGMALVFRAWSHQLRDFAVIKLLSPDLEDTPMLRQRWETEARLGQWLEHPGIARILDWGRADGDHAYLAMEYVSGQTLRSVHDELLMRQRRFPPHLAVAVTQAVLSALEFVHVARHPRTGEPLGVVHRDIKPANVMLTYDGQVKVLDFGVARVSLGLLRTQSGLLTGTPGYMSPEQVMADKRIDRRSDLYSWAVVLHELLTGHTLVPDDVERIDQLKAVLTDEPPLVQRVVPELSSPAVDRVLQTALAKAPDDRFESARAFWGAFQAAAVPELGLGVADELGRLVRSLFPGGLEKERLLRSMPRARSAPLTALVEDRRPPPVQPQSMDAAPQDPLPLPPSPLEVPPQVSGYVIEGRLGEGGTGVVFSVEHLGSGTERALKMLRPELAGHPDVRRRFNVEAQLGQKIAHPGVVRVFEVGEDSERRPYMVMERVEGQDLARWLRRLDHAGRRMPLEAAVRVSLEVLDVLEHVHRLEGPNGPLGIVHRDLKPSNVMVTPDGHVKVLDFGIARAWLGQARTRTGYRSGTEMYMSPEQALARRDLDHRSDLYSWATVMFELITNLPLLDLPAIEILPTLVHTPPARLLEPMRALAPRLMPPLERALQKAPPARFASAAEFATAVASAAPDLTGLGPAALALMWRAEPPVGPAHGRRRPRTETAPAADPGEAPTDGLPALPGYRVNKKLDEGGCGELWLATKAGDDTWWVIKTLRPELARRPDVARRFEREIRILSELVHPNVVRVHGARRTNEGQLFTVMEYIRGIDFERILYFFRTRRRLLPPELVLRVVLDVLAGLHAAHELSDDGRPVGVVHRDLSPRNLMVDADGTTKVIDFGLAAAQLTAATPKSRADVGTPRFWSPEQARGQVGVDRRSDLYAVAVIIHEALTGRALAPFAEIPEIRRAVLNDRPPRVDLVVPTLPATLGDVIERALGKSPAERFDTADDLRDALLAAWRHRDVASRAAVAEYLRREGPAAYQQAADRPPLAADGAGAAQGADTHEGHPYDLAADAAHPPTRFGLPAPPPAAPRGRWLFAAAAASVVVVATVLTASFEAPTATGARAPNPAPTPGSAAATAPRTPTPTDNRSEPDPVRATSPRAAPRSEPDGVRTARPSAAHRARSEPRPARRAPETTGIAAAHDAPPAATITEADRGPSRNAASPKPPHPERSVLEDIRARARNRLEAAELLRRAAARAEATGRLSSEARSKLESCLARRIMAPRDTVIHECGRWLQR